MISLGRLAKNIGSGYVGAAANGVVLLLLTPLVIRYLGPRDYGIWILTAAIGSYFGFLNAGSGPAAVRSVASLAGTGRMAEASRAVGSVFRIYLVIGIVACMGLILSSLTLLDFFHVPLDRQPTARWLLILIALNFLFSFPLGVTRSVLMGLHRFQLLNAVEIGSAFFRLTAAVLVLAAGAGLLGLVGVQLVASLGGHAARWIAIRRVAPEIHLTGGPGWEGLSPGIPGFSALSFGYESLRTLFDNADLLLIGFLAGPAAVGLFGVGFMLASLATKALQPFSGVLFPVASHMEARGLEEESARLLEVGTRMNLALVLPLLTILLLDGPGILRFWVGEGFSESSPVLLAFTLAGLVGAISLTSTTFLFGTGRVGTLLGAETIKYAANVALVLLFYRWFGFSGVAFGTLIAILVVDLALVRRACQRAGLEMGGFLRRNVGAPLLTALPVLVLLGTWKVLAPEPSLSSVIGRGAVCASSFLLIYALSKTFQRERQLVGKAWVEVFR